MHTPSHTNVCNKLSTDEGHSPETSEHLLRFWHFHSFITFIYCSNKCHAAYEAFLASYIYITRLSQFQWESASQNQLRAQRCCYSVMLT